MSFSFVLWSTESNQGYLYDHPFETTYWSLIVSSVGAWMRTISSPLSHNLSIASASAGMNRPSSSSPCVPDCLRAHLCSDTLKATLAEESWGYNANIMPRRGIWQLFYQSCSSYILSAQCSLTLTGCGINVVFKDPYSIITYSQPLSKPQVSIFICHSFERDVSPVKSLPFVYRHEHNYLDGGLTNLTKGQ